MRIAASEPNTFGDRRYLPDGVWHIITAIIKEVCTQFTSGRRARIGELDMMRVRTILGLIAGVILILSSAAHSLLGWKQMQMDLAGTQAPSNLVFGVSVGWHFGGVAMLAFGCIVTWLFLKRLKGENVSAFPALIVALAYLSFGAWALLASHMNPFFFIFIVPGLLLAVAALPVTQQGARR